MDALGKTLETNATHNKHAHENTQSLLTRVNEQFATLAANDTAAEVRLNTEVKAVTTALLAELHQQELRVKTELAAASARFSEALVALKADAGTNHLGLLAEIKALDSRSATAATERETRIQSAVKSSTETLQTALGEAQKDRETHSTALRSQIEAVVAQITATLTAQESRLQTAASTNHKGNGETLTAMEGRLGQKITDFSVLIQQSAGDVRTVKDLAEKQEANAKDFIAALKRLEQDKEARCKGLEESYNARLVGHLKSGVLLALVASSGQKVGGNVLAEYLETALAFGNTIECKQILGKAGISPLLPDLAANLRGGFLTDPTSEQLLAELRAAKATFSQAESLRKSKDKATAAKGATGTALQAGGDEEKKEKKDE